MKLINKIKAFFRWEKEQRWRYQALAPLLSIEMGAYTYDECLLAAGRSKEIPHEDVGIVAQCLFCRCNRGKVSMEEAIKLYGSRNKKGKI